MRVLTLFGSPTEGEGARAGWGGTADMAFLSTFVLAITAGIPLFPTIGVVKLLMRDVRSVSMVRECR